MTRCTRRRAAIWLPALAILWACGSGAPEAPPPPEVTVGKPVKRPVERYAEFTGTTRAIEHAEIRARVSGALEQILFEPSAKVEAGDVLFLIEPRTYRAAQDAASAQLASAQAQLAKASSDLERIEEASQYRAVSESDVDQARAARDEAHAAVLTARARLERASIELEYTGVVTPIPGRVGRNLVDAGNLVGTGEPTLLTTVTRDQPIYVYFDAPESLVLALLELQRKGEQEGAGLGKVLVATAADEGFPHEGRVDFIDNTVNPATGTIELRAVLPNAENVLFPGLFVRVRLLEGTDDAALLVQERAIGTDLAGKYVLVVGDENLVELRHLTLGPVQDDGTVVVVDGLEGNETYIVNGLLRARPGFPVTPQTEAEAKGEVRAKAAAEEETRSEAETEEAAKPSGESRED
jgi:RND family efflux transporter MFP subunit